MRDEDDIFTELLSESESRSWWVLSLSSVYDVVFINFSASEFFKLFWSLLLSHSDYLLELLSLSAAAVMLLLTVINMSEKVILNSSKTLTETESSISSLLLSLVISLS